MNKNGSGIKGNEGGEEDMKGNVVSLQGWRGKQK